MPEDIYASLWVQVRTVIEDGKICFNAEILEEIDGSIDGSIGECVTACAKSCCLEVGDDAWPWRDYLEQVERLREHYKDVISEYNGNRKSTVGLNDISIIGLAQTLGLPLISMESRNVHQQSAKRMRIPDVCAKEGVAHLTFNEFLRAEGITI